MASSNDLFQMARALCELKKTPDAKFTVGVFYRLAGGVERHRCARFLTIIRMSGKFGLVRLGRLGKLVCYKFREDADYDIEDVIRWWQR